MESIKQKIYRQHKGQKQLCGQLVSVIDEAKKLVFIGYSLCRKTDKFDKDLCLSIAYGRAFKNDRLLVPFSIQKDVDKFISRVARYYKGYELGTEVLEHSVFKCGKKA